MFFFANPGDDSSASEERKSRISTNTIRIASFLVVLAYFLVLAWHSLWVHFSADDMMNLGGYWLAGPWKVLQGGILYFTNFYRPMGGLFYLPIYHFAGLDPFPYRVVILCILSFNLWLAFRFAELISGSLLVAFLATLFFSYHGKLLDLVTNTCVIYDILCFTFYFLAFTLYLESRRKGEIPGVGRSALILGCYIGALDSKEMAVTLPVFFLAYELLFHPPSGARIHSLIRWFRNEGRLALLAGLLTAIYIPGKLLGQSGFAHMEAYRPVITWQRFVDQQSLYANAYLYAHSGAFKGAALALLWVTLLILAFVTFSRRRQLIFCWVFMLFGTLPITFLLNRTGACLYIPLIAWSIFAATLVIQFGQWLSRQPDFGKVPRWAVVGIVMLLAVNLSTSEALHEHSNLPFILNAQKPTWSVIEQLQFLNPKIPHGSKILILNDPFADFDAYFIAALWFRDPSLDIELGNKMNPPLDAVGIERFDWVFRFDEKNRLRQVRPAPRAGL